MTKRVFIDTAMNRKPHSCYDPNTDEFFKAEKLTSLKGYDEIYLDSLLFPGIWNELRDFVFNGYQVYHFTRSWRWRELRSRFREDLRERFRVKDVKKSDYGDAYVLWKVYETAVAKGNLYKWFKLVTVIDVKLKPLLMMERIYDLQLRRTCQYTALGIDMTADIKLFRDRVEKIRRMIVAEAGELWPRFMEVATKLGLDKDDLGGLTGLAGTLTYLGWPLRKPSMHKARRYFGIYRSSREDRLKFMERAGKKFQKHYSGSARRYLSMLTKSILTKEGKFPPRARDEREVLKRLIRTLKELESARV